MVRSASVASTRGACERDSGDGVSGNGLAEPRPTAARSRATAVVRGSEPDGSCARGPGETRCLIPKGTLEGGSAMVRTDATPVRDAQPEPATLRERGTNMNPLGAAQTYSYKTHKESAKGSDACVSGKRHMQETCKHAQARVRPRGPEPSGRYRETLRHVTSISSSGKCFHSRSRSR